MLTIVKPLLVACLAALLAGSAAYAVESAPQVQGLDEQVQEIKGEILSIAAELNQLEERLLYPSHTEVSIFVSVPREEPYRLDSVAIIIDGEPATYHLYTFKELEALQMGGVQRLYTGNIALGEHQLQVTANGKTTAGSDFQNRESFTLDKDVHPGIIELVLARGSITLKNR